MRGFVSRAGHLRGLARLAPRRVFELRPFVVARGQSGVAAGGGLASGGLEGAIDAGLDLKVGLTSDLVLDATVRPDFGQIEADQVVLNLSHFETFVPEKRPFFVEGVDVFRTPLPMFYSRRIGRSLNELEPGAPIAAGTEVAEVGEVIEPARLQTASKLVGELTPSWSIGLLAAVTGGESIATAGQSPARVEVAPPIGIAVARARWSPGGASSLGVTATGVSRLGGAVYRAAADHDAYTTGVDASGSRTTASGG